jgi:hypothetical protein
LHIAKYFQVIPVGVVATVVSSSVVVEARKNIQLHLLKCTFVALSQQLLTN